jgi:hypothetical protein
LFGAKSFTHLGELRTAEERALKQRFLSQDLYQHPHTWVNYFSRIAYIWGEGATYVAWSTIKPGQDDQQHVYTEQIDERMCTVLYGTAENLCLASRAYTQ